MSLDDPAPDLTAVDALRLGDRLQIGAAETLDVTDLGTGRLALSAPLRTGLAGALAAFEALTAEGSETVIVLEDAGWEPLAADLERRGVAGTRNMAAHRGYAAMDDEVFWDTITVQVPALIAKLRG